MKVGIIGAGASGMFAAISAAREGHQVTIIEHGIKAGKKILATGNGKCNFTNADMAVFHYNDDGRELFKSVYSRFDREALLDFFSNLGIIPYEKNGYYYPRSEQASSIVEALCFELDKLNVKFVSECNIKLLSKSDKFYVYTDKWDFAFDKLIIAAGSKASPKTGSDGSGYKLAESFSHKVIKPLPALCGLKCEEKFFKSIAGVRCRAMVSLFVDGEFVKADVGELQLTDYGISGIPVFQISADAVRALNDDKEVNVEIDFYPESSDVRDTFDRIKYLIEKSPDKNISSLLSGVFNKKLCNLFTELCGIDGSVKAWNLSDGKIRKLADYINGLSVHVLSANSDNAQICSGGVSCDELKPTLESKLVPGLYFAGEIIDVNGDCGGYNLQWAFSSGFVAGSLL